MSLHIEYLGFMAEGTTRDYRLRVRDGAGQPREFIVAIPNEAFISHSVRYQDAPDLCFKILTKALGAGDTPAYVTVTVADLDEYRQAQAPKPGKRRVRRPAVSAAAAEPAATPTAPAAPSPAQPKPRERAPFSLWRW